MVERIRRNTDRVLEQLADHLDDTPASASSGESAGGEDRNCNLYHETVCRGESSEGAVLSSLLGSQCERLPVKLCAGQCQVREGPVSCKNLQVTTTREEPREQCKIVPQRTCRTVRRLYPELVPQTRCSVVPRESCHLK